jgi:hypothetical protein
MCEVKMVENYEIERKIEDCKTEARWDSIDNDLLDECEKDREWYLDYIKKEDHPMAYRVKKEIDEWAQTAPLFDEMAYIEDTIVYMWLGYGLLWFGMGFFLVAYIFGS